MKILTKEQIQEIREMQKALDIRVRENNNIPMDKDLNLEKYIALKTELFEFVNEVESFKYWKKNKGKSHILEEACDTLHFIFSLAIDNKAKLVIDEEFIKNSCVDKFDTNELIGMIDASISDTFIEKDWENLSIVLTFLLALLEKSNFTPDDLYNEYIRKNKVNHERQDNNY